MFFSWFLPKMDFEKFKGCLLCLSFMQKIVNQLAIGFSIAIMALQESLPLLVAFILAYTVNKMNANKNSVNKYAGKTKYSKKQGKP